MAKVNPTCVVQGCRTPIDQHSGALRRRGFGEVRKCATLILLHCSKRTRAPRRNHVALTVDRPQARRRTTERTQQARVCHVMSCRRRRARARALRGQSWRVRFARHDQLGSPGLRTVLTTFPEPCESEQILFALYHNGAACGSHTRVDRRQRGRRMHAGQRNGWSAYHAARVQSPRALAAAVRALSCNP